MAHSEESLKGEMMHRLLAVATAVAAAPGFLEETATTSLCDDVQQYAGYYKLTTGK